MKRFTQISKFAAMAAIAAIGISLYACEEKGNAFTDARDSKKYRTVKIGEQVWMAENLNFETPDSQCYENKPENCKKYGRLYTWDEAMKACPVGWHLPVREEWDALIEAAGGKEMAGKNLKAKSGWDDKALNGLDTYGFAALPGGRGYRKDDFGQADGAFLWSATADDADVAWNLYISYSSWNSNNKGSLFSIRCLEGATAVMPPEEKITEGTLKILEKLKTVSLPYKELTNFDNFSPQNAHKLTDSETRELKWTRKITRYQEFTEPTLNYKVNLSDKFHAIVISYTLGDHNLYTKLVTYDKEYNVIDVLDIAFDEIAESCFSQKSTIYKDRIAVESYSCGMEDGKSSTEKSEWRIEPDGKFKQTAGAVK
jgi:uncharacterized protein (TIGR02145 family)